MANLKLNQNISAQFQKLYLMNQAKQTSLFRYMSQSKNNNNQHQKNDNKNTKQKSTVQKNINTQSKQKNLNHNQKPQIQSDMSYKSKEDKQAMIQISGSESSEAIETDLKKREQMKDQAKKKENEKKNVNFYLNKIVSEPSGDYIENVHKKWWGDFRKLQAHHGFIQWLFPNSFQSRFNQMAEPLSLQQAQQFRTNIQISKRYQKSYMMMLQFYGMKLKCKQSGEIVRSRHPMLKQKSTLTQAPLKKSFYEERYYKTFLTSFHNHMRITRMLSSLVMCGFGRYAKELSIFLGKEINSGGLQGLKKYGVYERQWKQYSEYIEKQAQKNILLSQYDKMKKS